MIKRIHIKIFFFIIFFSQFFSCERSTKNVMSGQTFELTKKYQFYFSTGNQSYKKLSDKIDLKKIIGNTEIITDSNIEANIIDFKITPKDVRWSIYHGDGTTTYTVSGFEMVIKALFHVSEKCEIKKCALYIYFPYLYEIGKYIGAAVIFVKNDKFSLLEDNKVFFYTINIKK